MLRALSTHPPPNPNNKEMGSIMYNDVALDIKKSAKLVTNIENADIARVEKRLAILENERELMTVPIQAIILTVPAMDTSAPMVGYIIGHAAPSMLSGRPNEMKDMYIMINKRIENILPPETLKAHNSVILSIFYQGEGGVY